MLPKVIGMIPARYGSTRFPAKPLALIQGKTLIQRTYENAKRSSLLSEVYVVTDDYRIHSHVHGFGGIALMTPSACPTGTERLAAAIRNHPELASFPAILNVQGDEPLLEAAVIESVIQALFEDPAAVMSTAAVPIRTQEEAEDRCVNKCVMDRNGNALYFSRGLIPHGHSGAWQPRFPYYKHLGIYCYRTEFLLHYAELQPTPLQLAEDLEQLKVLEHGFRIKVAVVESASIGVDRPEDIKKVEERL